MSDGAFAGGVRTAVAATVRRLPVGAGTSRRYLKWLNRLALRLGASPHVVAPMRIGHRMHLDLRSGTEWPSFYSGEFDDARVRAACALLRPGSVAVDAGANIGFWTVPLAHRAAHVNGRVIAVEPIPSNAERLRNNLRLNGLEEAVDIWRLALSDRSGTVTMTLREDFARGAGTGNAAVMIPDRTDRQFETVTTPLTSLDARLDGRGNRPVSLIKADLEGHEDRFLRGAYRTLERYRPVAFVEWNRIYYRRRTVDPTRAVRPILRSLDYVCLRQDRERWRPTPEFRSDRPIDDLVMVPTSRADETAEILESFET